MATSAVVWHDFLSQHDLVWSWDARNETWPSSWETAAYVRETFDFIYIFYFILLGGGGGGPLLLISSRISPHCLPIAAPCRPNARRVVYVAF